jgi:hypothetical protein
MAEPVRNRPVRACPHAAQEDASGFGPAPQGNHSPTTPMLTLARISEHVYIIKNSALCKSRRQDFSRFRNRLTPLLLCGVSDGSAVIFTGAISVNSRGFRVVKEWRPTLLPPSRTAASSGAFPRKREKVEETAGEPVMGEFAF